MEGNSVNQQQQMTMYAQKQTSKHYLLMEKIENNSVTGTFNVKICN